MSNVHHPETDSEAKQLCQKGRVVVKFGAEWCPPCVKIQPLLVELAAKNSSYNLVLVDVDKCEDFANEHQIEGLPTIKIINDGSLLEQSVGFKD